MSINPDLIQKIITSTTQIIGSCTSITIAIVAIYGLKTWRRQLKGTKRFELAEEVLTLFYAARDKITFFRNPMTFSEEGKTRTRGAQETEIESKTKDRFYIVIERYKNNEEVFNKLFALRFRFATYFGENTMAPFDDLCKLLNDLFLISWELMDNWEHPSMAIDLDENKKRIENARSKLWGGYAKPDPVATRVDEIIQAIEAICKRIIHH